MTSDSKIGLKGILLQKVLDNSSSSFWFSHILFHMYICSLMKVPGWIDGSDWFMSIMLTRHLNIFVSFWAHFNPCYLWTIVNFLGFRYVVTGWDYILMVIWAAMIFGPMLVPLTFTQWGGAKRLSTNCISLRVSRGAFIRWREGHLLFQFYFNTISWNTNKGAGCELFFQMKVWSLKRPWQCLRNECKKQKVHMSF